MKKYIFILIISLFAIHTNAQNPRISYSINSDWEFHKGELSEEKTNEWQSISIPHTWNTKDAFDDKPGYYRGIGIYKKSIFFPEKDKNKSIAISFDGANQETAIFVNGVSIGSHKGGYTAFSFPITKEIKFGENNEILVKVTNAFDENIPTLKADFTFFGGIYRDVFIEKMNLVHFNNSKYGGKNVLISTPKISKETASIQFKGQVLNESSSTKKIEIYFQKTLLDIISFKSRKSSFGKWRI